MQNSDGQLSVGGNIKSLCSKHLGAAVYRMHQIGVVAAVAVMRAVGGVRVSRDDEGYLQRHLRGSNAVALFGSLWDELHRSLSNIPASSTRIAAFFDLMAATVESGNLHEDIVAIVMQSEAQPAHARAQLCNRIGSTAHLPRACCAVLQTHVSTMLAVPDVDRRGLGCAEIGRG